MIAFSSWITCFQACTNLVHPNITYPRKAIYKGNAYRPIYILCMESDGTNNALLVWMMSLDVEDVFNLVVRDGEDVGLSHSRHGHYDFWNFSDGKVAGRFITSP